jgi:hypothetical protein
MGVKGRDKASIVPSPAESREQAKNRDVLTSIGVRRNLAHAVGRMRTFAKRESEAKQEDRRGRTPRIN